MNLSESKQLDEQIENYFPYKKVHVYLNDSCPSFVALSLRLNLLECKGYIRDQSYIMHFASLTFAVDYT